MIKSFGCKETEKISNGETVKIFSLSIQKTARRKLRHIASAISINDLRVPPKNKLKKMKGEYSEYHSIRINKQFRILFIWNNGGAENVKIIDPH